ncbi:hypothetical protein [Paenibacillus tyrfis]|uniref:hypothetical protein n=1 Tax=Paenibacillus tyrfis TaxID=1501230 RepID=UPI00209CBB75|nr:hypothetical protein [Paenibacillus tyrfis]MCP1312415.1 hypothetical protein [Paenibacillus tyrfis]
MRKHYALGVIGELQRLGYSEEDAKIVFLRYYRGMKRSYGLNMNVNDFAKAIDEINRAVNRKNDPQDQDLIYIGQIRERLRKHSEKGVSDKIFRISKEMEQKIKEWDTCVAEDVSGAQFAYTFIPMGLGLVIKVKCDVCKRELDLSEW